MSRELLYELLPAVIRDRDATRGEQLRALMLVLQRVFDEIRTDIDAAYDDLFIETCRAEIVPYLGDLVGAAIPEELAALPGVRPFVGSIVDSRRRKGLGWVAGRVAADVSGWAVRATETDRTLAWTQSLPHVRPALGRRIDLRDLRAIARIGGPFDASAHVVDLRAATTIHAPTRLALFAWRLQSRPVELGSATNADGDGGATKECYRFSPFTGVDLQLFGTGDGNGAATAAPGPLDRRELDPTVPPASPPLRVFLQKTDDPTALSEVPWAKMRFDDLSDWTAAPAGDALVSVDPRSGRLRLLAGSAPQAVRVSYSYGLSGDLGGGPGDRAMASPDSRTPLYLVGPFSSTERHDTLGPDFVRGRFPSLTLALQEWARRKEHGIVRLSDSRTWSLGGGWTTIGGAPFSLTIDAARGQCPCIRGDANLVGSDEAGSAITLSGLWWEGRIVAQGGLRLTIADCTLKPGATQAAALQTTTHPPGTALVVSVLRSIVGALLGDRTGTSLHLADSVVDGSLAFNGPALDPRTDAAGSVLVMGIADGSYAIRGPADQRGVDGFPGPPSRIERTTLFGRVDVATLEATDTLFESPVAVSAALPGEVAYCHVPPESTTPPRRKCVPGPDTSFQKPTFTSVRWGDPGYAQIATTTSAAIRTGATNGSEIGVFQRLMNADRERWLSEIVPEYVPVTLRHTIVRVT